MLLGSCGMCKHWGTRTETHNEYRSCKAVIHDAESLTGDDDQYQDALVKTEFRARHPATVVDGSGFFAALRSRADFGCMLFTVKSCVEVCKDETITASSPCAG